MLKGVTKTIKNETKKQKGRFLSMLLGTLGARLLGNLLSRKGIVGAGFRNKKGKGTVRDVYGNKMVFNAASSFNKLWNTKYYQNEPRFHGVLSRDNFLKKIKHRAYAIKLDEYADVGTHGLLYFVRKLKLFIFIVFVFNMFLEKLNNLLGIKTQNLTYSEYNQTIQ